MSELSLQPREHLDLLYQASLEFNSTLDFEELLPRVFDRTLDILDAEAGSIWLRQGSNLVCAIARGPVREQTQRERAPAPLHGRAVSPAVALQQRVYWPPQDCYPQER